MEIINQTCYNTEDLRALWDQAKASYTNKLNDPNSRSWWRSHYQWKDPERIVIGYFKARNQSDVYPSYTSVRKKPVLRLGIVKKGDMPWGHALTALAEAANGKEMGLPQIVVKQIIRSMIECGGGYAGVADLPLVDGEEEPRWGGRRSRRRDEEQTKDTEWDWIKSFTLRFNERAKRGSRKAAARARKLGRLDQMRREIAQAKANIAEQQAAIVQHQAELVKLEEELRESVEAVEAAEQDLVSKTEALTTEE